MTEIGQKPTDNPNNRYSSPKNIGTWSSPYGVEEFLYKFNHYNNYYNEGIMLSLGDYVTIQDGTYNEQWVIAGFDMEHDQTAADGTVYDNGYGIFMIPKTITNTSLYYLCWNENNNISGAYMSSTMHTSTLPTIVTKLQNILGSHIVNRNVLLSSSTTYVNPKHSNAYTWTTSYATLMSVGQMTGTFAKNSNKYDDGEANYKLPLFNYESYKTGFKFWTRNVWGINTDRNEYCAWLVMGNGTFTGGDIKYDSAVRPLIYLR